MKKLTKGQRFALAREARRLAMECVEGTAPELNHGTWTGCAMSVVVGRAGVAIPKPIGWTYRTDQPAMTAIFVEQTWGGGAPGLVSAGLHSRIEGGVVFPLLALADALEMSAADASKTQKEVP